jgi:hypothetical protein
VRRVLRRSETRAAAMVFPAWHENLRLPVPALPAAARQFSAEPHMNWHGVCQSKQHLITFSDRTPGCFGWNSSPSHAAPVGQSMSRYILYQPFTSYMAFQLKSAANITVITINTIIKIICNNRKAKQ